MSGPIDLSKLPPPKVVEELSFEEILQQRKAKFLDLYPDAADVIDLESEPINYLLQENAYREVVWRQRVNEAAKSVMLLFSKSSDLDQIMANLYTKRKVLEPADPNAIPPKPAVMESDEDFRMRGEEAFERLAVAGPQGPIEAIARSASPLVKDVKAHSPAGAELVVVVLSAVGNGVADSDLVTTVEDALNPEEVRMLSDELNVFSAVIIEHEINAVVYLPKGPEAPKILEAAIASLNKFIARYRIGQNIYRSAIISALQVEGVINVDLITPAASIMIDKNLQAGYCTAINITSEIESG